MGVCTSASKKTGVIYYLEISQPILPPKETSVSTEIKALSTSLLYNYLVKNHNRAISSQSKHYEVFDVRSQESYQALQINDSINFPLKPFYEKKLELPKELKIILNLKTLIIVGLPELPSGAGFSEEFVHFLKEIDRVGIKINTLYIYKHKVEHFLSSFEFFSHDAKDLIKSFYLPLLLLDRSDFAVNHHLNEPQKAKSSSPEVAFSQCQRVYIQNHQKFESYFPNFLAEKLHAHIIYFTTSFSTSDISTKYKFDPKKLNQSTHPPQGETYAVYHQNILDVNNEQQSYFPRLIKSKSNILVVDESISSKRVISLIKETLKRDIKVDSDSIWRYIDERIPNITTSMINLPDSSPEQKKNENKGGTKEGTININNSSMVQLLTRCDELRQNISDLKKETNSIQLTIELYELTLRMIDNIIKDPQDEKYRNLNSGNVKLKSTIFKYPACIKILNTIGFIHKDQQTQLYNNSLDLKNIKLIRSDLALAFRQFNEASDDSNNNK